MKLKIALLQINSGKTQGESLVIGAAACKKAAALGADVALFPELWNCGYDLSGSQSDVNARAVERESEYVAAFSALARELEMAIAVTFLEKAEGKAQPLNSVALFDMRGEKALHYSKVHTCDFGDERLLAHGEGFYVAPLQTKAGAVNVGAMICYDREFPESARVLMLKGAELLLVPNACPMEINRLSQLRARAFENMLAIATCNYPAPHPDCNGRSTVFDGVAYLPQLPHSRDTCIFEAGESEGVFIAELDVDMLRSYRKREVHGNAYRRPEKYGLLLSAEKREPFLRRDFRE